MTDLQKLQVDMSKVRTAMLELSKETEPTPEQRAAMVAHTDEAIALNKKFEELMAAAPIPASDDKPEHRELVSVLGQAKLTRYLNAIIKDEKLDGAERELRDTLFKEGTELRAAREHSIPIHMFLPDDEMRELRVATVSAGDGMVTTHAIYERIFARSDAMYLGARFEPVAAGTQRYPIVASGGELAFHNENPTAQASATGSITAVDSDPVEGTLLYDIGRSSALRFGDGVVENAFRNDARMSIASGIDDTIINGNTGPNIPGFLTAIGVGAAATANVTPAIALGVFADQVDGKYAYGWEDVRQLVRKEVYAAVVFEPLATNNPRLFGEFVGQERFRATERLPAPSSNDSHAIVYRMSQDPGDLVVPMWDDVTVTYDPISRRDRNQVRIVFNLAMNVVFKRTDNWVRVQYQTA